MQSLLKKATPFISVIFFGLAVWFLNLELGRYSIVEINRYISQISVRQILLSLLLCALSYALLTLYDALAVEYVGRHLGYNKIAKAGFIGYGFSHNIGMALITGGSIRYRLYSAWGFTGVEVTKMVGFSALTLWLGFCSMGGLSFLIFAPHLPHNIISVASLRILGIVLWVMIAIYGSASVFAHKKISFWRWSFTVPGSMMAIKQIAIASVDWLLASLVLYVLLPAAGIPFFGFLGIFLLAQIAGLFSQVPGGLGVFESIVTLYLTNFISGSAVIGILLMYRLIYYLIPLVLAMFLLGYQEYKTNRRVVREFGDRTAKWLPQVVPSIFSVTIFIGGVVLLFSGAVPSDVPRIHWLQPFVPLPVIETSRFLASIVGAVLLILAHGLQRRIDAAWHTTIGVLSFGILFSVLKGASYVEAAILAVMLIALIPSRKEFHRRAVLFSESFSPVWMTMIFMVVISSIWLGLFSYQYVEYQGDLWWHLSLLSNAPLYIRASVAVLGAALIFGLIKLFKPSRIQKGTEQQQVEAAQSIVNQSPRAQSKVLLLEDKKLLFSDKQQACLMYGVEGKSWIAMGDPMGSKDEIEGLIWKFSELSENNDGWPVFYQVHNTYLDFYNAIGLMTVKMGEEARINLAGINSPEQWPQEVHTLLREMASSDYQYEVIQPDAVSSVISELKEVSDSWLSIKDNEERKFSTGYFKEKYLSNFPVGIIHKRGDIVAFSNIWQTANKQEARCDLLRFKADMPSKMADFLLAGTMQWSRDQGYQWFNLGLAPLEEMTEKNLGYNRLKFAGQLFGYNEQFHNLEGLRRHREKFNPEWEPVYIGAPAGLKFQSVLANLMTLLSRQSIEHLRLQAGKSA